MGSKIRVSDLARMMGIASQDLIFKLRSLGARIEGEDAQIDSDAIQAILQGKKLPQPREVILRDDSAAAPPPPPRRGAPAPPPPTRRPTPSPLRPGARRTMIQPVDSRIKSLDGDHVRSDDGGDHEAYHAEPTEAYVQATLDLPEYEAESAPAVEHPPAAVPTGDVSPATEAAPAPEAPVIAAVAAPTEAAAPVAAEPPPAAPAPAAPAAPPTVVAPAATTVTAPPVAAAPAPGPTAPPAAPAAPTPRPPERPEKPPEHLRTGLIAPPPPNYQPPPRPGRGPLPPPARPGMGPGGPGRPGMGPGGPSRPGMGPGGPSRPGMGPSRPGMGPGGPSRPGMGPGRPGMGPGGPSRPGMGPGGPGRPGMGPGGPGRPGSGPSGPGMNRRPGMGTGPSPAPPSITELDRQREREKEREKKVKKGVKKQVGQATEVDDEDLRALRGAMFGSPGDDLDPDTPLSARRRRRVERKEEEEASGGTVVQFRRAPSGSITISEGMTVRDFSEKLGVKSKDLIAALFRRGILSNINQVLEPELALKIAKDFGIEAMVVTFEEEVQLAREADEKAPKTGKVPRAPVVTIMGHVDHGKTSLLDAIRSSKVTESEFGGITQHIGAYDVTVNNRRVVFLDTPGHEAFTLMRSRGAKATDVVVLVVAADDGVMPQTIEAINHAKAAKVPLVVAINKIDKANANLDRVKKELADHGVLVEEWGGDIVAVPISALKREGIQELLEMIALQADILDLKANPDIPAQGVVIEAKKDVGRGIVATVLVQDGTLRAGDIFVAGATWGRIRSMADDVGKRLKEAGPATPIEITGFSEVPDAGDPFQIVGEEEKARSIAEFRQGEARRRDLNPTTGKLTLEQLFSQIQQGEVKDLPVVLKADVQGSVEVLRDTLEKLSTEKVRVQVLHSGVGAITTNDVLLASASKAIVVGFNVRPERNAADLAEHEKVDIRLHTIIYELLEELKLAMTGLLAPTFREVSKGRAEVREIFKVPKVGIIAGCHVIEGVIPRTSLVRLLRDSRVIFEGKLSSLRRFKDDASEVRSGFDCGIGLEKFQDMKPGDIIEAFVKEQVAATL